MFYKNTKSTPKKIEKNKAKFLPKPHYTWKLQKKNHRNEKKKRNQIFFLLWLPILDIWKDQKIDIIQMLWDNSLKWKGHIKI
jgi:hypothetical protein